MVSPNLGEIRMDQINVEHDEHVAILKLNRGITNALNLDFLQELSNNLQNLAQDDSVKGVVIASNNNKFFSIGFDLPQLFELNQDKLRSFYQTFNRVSLEIYTFPKPVIAALTGHAIAGGCILAICCDYRFIANDRKLMGLNEIKLGLPVPYPADCILRQLLGPKNAQEMVYTGEFYQPERSLQMGLVDQVVSLENVVQKSIEKAKTLAAMPTQAFEIVKRNRVEPIKEQIQKQLKKKEQFFYKCWFSENTHELLKEAITKF